MLHATFPLDCPRQVGLERYDNVLLMPCARSLISLLPAFIWYNGLMLLSLPSLARLMRSIVAVVLLLLAATAAVLAFPHLHGVLRSTAPYATLWALLAAFVAVTLRALCRRRWLSALFHAGVAAVIVGGGVTAGYAKEWQVGLVDSPIAPPEYRQRMIDGDLVALSAFIIETYPNGMPRQYRTRLLFPEGEREVAVNAPLRRKGLTYYQMSYSKAYDPYGRQVWQTHLTVRRDPGVPITFMGYGALVLAAAMMAVREVRQ